ncbi:hypothetical protein EV127DRAFT_139268 [Xylaria flabelliformis]|nr:hypothetical protein EV127DRAFT_139268 [Xylaria flabelliformis]
MEPLSALSVAANVVQFVDFAFRLISSTGAIMKSRSGLARHAKTLDAIAKDAVELSDVLAASPALASSNITLQALLSECKTIAGDLLVALDKLRVKKAKKWNCFVAALRTMWSKGKIDEFVDRLGRVQAQISTHMHFLLLEHMNKESAHISALRENSQRLGIEDQGRVEKLRSVVVTRLEKLSKETSKTPENTMDSLKLDAPKPTASHPDRFGLSLDLINYFSGIIKQLAEEQALTEANQDFLESLYFSKIKTRRRKIETAHAKTFGWIFQPSISFNHWLREGSGTFWVQGKAGSGKSTLMKFICSHPMTMKSLQEWAGSKRLVTAEFFFWSAGSVLQKSREGLLRSLLFEILRKCPELIPRVTKSNHEVLFRRRGPYPYIDDEELWSQEDLMVAYRSLVSHCDEEDVKFCFFIDGLDEFEEERKTHSDLIETLRVLNASQNIKFCVSSRPWTVFSDAFGEDPDRLLKLEDLTRDDIRSYVHDKFKDNTQFKLLSIDNLQYAGLVEDITRQAQGVFLWVYLVVRDLLEGFSHSDTIRTMRKRLESFPAELEQFFQHMIDSVSPIYVPQMVRTLWLATSAPEPQFLMVYSLLDDASDDIAAFTDGYSLKLMHDEEVRMRTQQMRRRIDGRCKGLLEVVTDDPNVGLYFECKVDFLHRTVRDFLLGSPEIRQILDQQRFADLSGIGHCASNVWLLPCLSILEAFKRAPFNTDPRVTTAADTGIVRRLLESGIARRLLEGLMIFAHEAEVNTTDRSALVRILCDAEDTYYRRKQQFAWSLENYLFLGLACQAGLFSYIRNRITGGWFTQPSNLIKVPGHQPPVTLLSFALDPAQTLHPRIIQHLLAMGADPNEPVIPSRDDTSSWCRFLRDVSAIAHLRKDERVRETIHLLLKHGANIDARIFWNNNPIQTGVLAESILYGKEHIAETKRPWLVSWRC